MEATVQRIKDQAKEDKHFIAKGRILIERYKEQHKELQEMITQLPKERPPSPPKKTLPAPTIVEKAQPPLKKSKTNGKRRKKKLKFQRCLISKRVNSKDFLSI